MNTVRAPDRPWGSCTHLGGPVGQLLTPPLDRGRWAQWGPLLSWGWSLLFRPCPSQGAGISFQSLRKVAARSSP